MQPENQPKKYDQLFNEIDCGRIKIPRFQRDFVWTQEQTAALIDSIIKGYPIGTFIFWKTREDLRRIKNVGNVELPEIPKGDAAWYVLDGQQRITSLYAVRKGIVLSKDGHEVDYKRISINLDMDPNGDEQIVTTEPPKDAASISVHRLLTGGLASLAADYGEYLEKIDIYRSQLTGYDFSTIVIADYPLDIACDVFTRINTGGTKLTLFEIMVAKTYDQDRDFDLAQRYDWLVDNKGAEKDLEDAGFETIPDTTILQCVAAHLSHQVRARDILKLGREDFVNSWPVVTDGLFGAIDYVRTQLRIPVSSLLPYHTLIVPLTYFYVRNGGREPTPLQSELFIQYFWWASLSNRFSSGVESKLGQDLHRMDAILDGQAPSYEGEEVRLTMDDLRWRWFSTGDAICKAILCLYAYHQPTSFRSNAIVKLDNSWLKQANSVNYHHFFPKSYLRKCDVPEWKANCILNITLVDANLNKRAIRARPPSDYMEEFRKTNTQLEKTLESHLISGAAISAIWDNNYNAFIESRGEAALADLNQRLNPILAR